MPPKLIASFLGREITFLESELPAWMDEALGQTPFSTVKLREFFEQGKPCRLPTDSNSGAQKAETGASSPRI